MTVRFEAYCGRKVQAAIAANIPGYTTVDERVPREAVGIANAWSRARFDGPFYRSAVPQIEATPITSLVFVQSLDGNTVVADPSTLGGGTTDLHVVYEGLSRVDADAVMAGAATARAREIVFSVWHPELVALRHDRGKTRHPAQVVATNRGDLRFDDGLMFLEPDLQVFVITRTAMADVVRRRVEGRGWIDVIDAGEPVSFGRAFRYLKRHGIDVLSCVGGRRTSTALLTEGLVSDIYVTTSAREGGEPETPYYQGPPLPLDRILLKEGQHEERGVTFEHLRVRTASGSQV
jgi:riboflavin biosynthesis pyrimidine reductase